MKQKQEIIHIMPVRLRMKLEQILREQEDLEEIRIRIGQPVELCCQNKEIWLKECITEEDLEEMLTFISKYSIYAYEEEIRQGYLTIEGRKPDRFCRTGTHERRTGFTNDQYPLFEYQDRK